MVAVEAKTGKYLWHFQQAHHAIWDYDSPNAVIPLRPLDQRTHAEGRG
jgi:glucose dehydrogenase